MARKRPSMRGKGADIFLAPEELEERPKSDKGGRKATKMVTFHLPVELEQKLDEVWLELRRYNRGVRKSGIVAFALDKILQDYMDKKSESELFKEITQT